MEVSALSYGNWITHGSQIEEDTAWACVHAALDEGITTFDTADVYAQGAAETVLGRALEGQLAVARLGARVGRAGAYDGTKLLEQPGPLARAETG